MGTSNRYFEVRHDVSFLQCACLCLENKEFVAEWERLSGKRLFAVHPLDQMIDEATGYDMVAMGEFVDFVYEYVFLRF